MAQLTVDIFNEIVLERWKQDGQWGGREHDDTHINGDWTEFIKKHNDRAVRPGYDFRKQMIKVAALALAAIQSHDRRAGM